MWQPLLPLFLLTALCPIPAASARAIAQKSAGARAEVTWAFDTHEDHDANPRTKVFLVVGAHRVLVTESMANFNVVERKDFQEHAVPAAALTACSGWWAGQGQDLYVTRRGRNLVVYSRDLDEQAPASRYKRLKVIPSP